MPREKDDADFDNFDVELDTADDKKASAKPGKNDDQFDLDLVVDVVDDTPAADRKAQPLDREVEDPTDDEMQSYGEKVQKRIKDLTHARHDERRRREKLEREQEEMLAFARQSTEEVKRLRKIVEDGTKQYSEMSTAAAKTNLEAARAKLRAAHEAYDTDAIVAAQEELFNAQAAAERAKEFKGPTLQVESDGVQTPQVPKVQPLDPKTRNWMAKNSWFTDPAHTSATTFALGLDQELRQSGYDPRTDEYFEQVDARMKRRFPELYKAPSEDDRPAKDDPPRRPGSVVAPADRSAPKRRVTLTASQVALCTKLNLDPKQYAAQLVKDGKL
jgi:hypothetical protein